MQAARKTSTAPSRLPSTVQESLAPTMTMKAARRRFACGEDVEVRSRFPQVPGKKQLVIYARAKVVSVSVGTDSYVVRYPAASSIPSRTARVPAWDVRAARPVPPPPPAADAARPPSSKRPLQSDQSGSDGDSRKKARRTGQGIPEDALQRFFAEHEEEEEAKKQKAREHDDELLEPKLRPKTRTIKMMDRACPAFVSAVSSY